MLKFDCTISQNFGGSISPVYYSLGLRGHPGLDQVCGYGSPVKAIADGYVYSLYTPENPASDGFTCIYTIVETALEHKEIAYGHLSEINVKYGDVIKKGQVIGREGNKGYVYQGGMQITLAMQKAGDRRGSHTHYQDRPLIKTRVTIGKMLQDTKGTYQDWEGFYYSIAMPTNGYAGCVDPLAPIFASDMFYGLTSYKVRLLQRALVKQGFLAPTNDTGYFGGLTKKAVQDFQAKNNLSPLFGYAGSKTRGILNTLYPNL